MKVSIIICTFNRCDFLAQALESLLNLAVPHALGWEVLIVDNNSTDSTKRVAESFTARHPELFRYIFESTQGKSFALNTGIREARGEILAFSDDDVTFDSQWLTELNSTFDKFDCAGVGGKIIPVWSSPKPDWFQEDGPHKLSPAIVSFNLGDSPCPLKTAPFGANMAFRKEMFLKYGGFRADLGLDAGRRIGAEDSEFCRRLFKAGESTFYAPRAIVYHPVEKRRTEKKYFQDWYLGRGRASIREMGIPADAIRYLGVPRYLLAGLFRGVLNWLLSFDSKRRFYYKLEVCETMGRIQEARITPPARP
jgi:glycosyltransferase involved in cell wall biosynthesis